MELASSPALEKSEFHLGSGQVLTLGSSFLLMQTDSRGQMSSCQHLAAGDGLSR